MRRRGQSVGSIEKPILQTLGSPSPLTRTYFPPPYSHTQSTSGNHYSRGFLAVSTFPIVVLLWMQHICCTVLGTLLPFWPFQKPTWPLKNVATLCAKNHPPPAGLRAGRWAGRPIYTWYLPSTGNLPQRQRTRVWESIIWHAASLLLSYCASMHKIIFLSIACAHLSIIWSSLVKFALS